MKKNISLLLIICVFSGLMVSGLSANDELVITAGNYTVEAGEEFWVDFRIENGAGVFTGFHFILTTEKSVVAFDRKLDDSRNRWTVTRKSGDIWKEPPNIAVNAENPSCINAAGGEANPVEEDGVFFRVKMIAVGEPGDEVTLNFSETTAVGLVNGNITSNVARFIDGSVNIKADYILTINSGAGGSTRPDKKISLRYGDTKKIEAIPDSGYKFVNWTHNGEVISEKAVFDYTMPAENVTLKANFVRKEYTLKVESSDGGLTEPVGEHTKNYEEVITLTAIPDSGYKFVNWTHNGEVISEEAVFDYTMPAENVTLKANFVRKEYTLKIESSDGGLTEPVGEHTKNYEEVITLKAMPEDNYKFMSWTHNGEVISDEAEFNYTMPAENVTLIANFALKTEYVEAKEAVNALFDRDGTLLEEVTQADIDHARNLVLKLEDGEDKNKLLRKLIAAQEQLDAREKEDTRFGYVLNEDKITVIDVIVVLRHIVGLTDLKTGDYPEGAYDRARVSGEDAVSVQDAILILRYVVNLISEFPAEEIN